MNNFLISKVVLRISEPWEMGQALKWEAFEAEVISVIGNEILIRLLSPFVFRNTTCEFFIVSPRYAGDQLTQLNDGISVFCSMTRISTEQASSNSPYDLKSWRGGIAIIGNIDPVI